MSLAQLAQKMYGEKKALKPYEGTNSLLLANEEAKKSKFIANQESPIPGAPEFRSSSFYKVGAQNEKGDKMYIGRRRGSRQ